jgi:hypothetical protein
MIGACSTVAPSHGPSVGPPSKIPADAVEAEGAGATLAAGCAVGDEATPLVSLRGPCWPQAPAPNASEVNRNTSGRAMERD